MAWRTDDATIQNVPYNLISAQVRWASSTRSTRWLWRMLRPSQRPKEERAKRTRRLWFLDLLYMETPRRPRSPRRTCPSLLVESKRGPTPRRRKHRPGRGGCEPN